MTVQTDNKKKKKSFLLVLLVIVSALCLLTIVDSLNVGFRWLFELIILGAAVAVTYRILRTGYCIYECRLIDKNLVITQRMGSGERYLFTLGLSDVRQIISSDKTAQWAETLGLKKVPAYYTGDADGEVYGLIYRDSEKYDKMITFKPSSQIVEVLSKAALDNAEKM